MAVLFLIVPLHVMVVVVLMERMDMMVGNVVLNFDDCNYGIDDCHDV